MGSLRLDLSIGVKADPEAVRQGKARAPGGADSTVPLPDQGLLESAALWLGRGKAQYEGLRYEEALAALHNAVAVVQVSLIEQADPSGRISRTAQDLLSPGPQGPPGHDSVEHLGGPELLTDAFFWRAACNKAIGAVDDALADLDRLLEWHTDATGFDSAQRLRAADLYAVRALCCFEGLHVQEALDNARRAVGLSPDAKEPQEVSRTPYWAVAGAAGGEHAYGVHGWRQRWTRAVCGTL